MDEGRIDRSAVIERPRARVWRALADVEEFGRWFGVETEGRFAPGARVKMVSTLEGPYQGLPWWVEIVEMTPESVLAWRWHPGAPDFSLDYTKEPTTLVRFTLEDAGVGTRVTVAETGFESLAEARRAKVIAENTGGWEYQMKSLARYAAESG